MGERIYHHGVPIDNLTEDEAFITARALMERGHTNHMVTLTIGMYLAARKDPAFADLLTRVPLVVPESTGLKLYSWIVKPSFGRILSGRYLAERLIEFCAETDRSVVLFGSSPQNRLKAIDSFRQRYGCERLSVIDGEYTFANPADSKHIAERLDKLHPDFAVMAGTEVTAENWINQWIVNEGINVHLIGNFGQTIDCEAGIKWVPIKTLTKIGIAWLPRIPTMTPERRKRYLKVLWGLSALCLNDSLDSLVKNSSQEPKVETKMLQ